MRHIRGCELQRKLLLEANLQISFSEPPLLMHLLFVWPSFVPSCFFVVETPHPPPPLATAEVLQENLNEVVEYRRLNLGSGWSSALFGDDLSFERGANKKTHSSSSLLSSIKPPLCSLQRYSCLSNWMGSCQRCKCFHGWRWLWNIV